MEVREPSLPIQNLFMVLNRKRKVFVISASLIFLAVITMFVAHARTYDSTAVFQFQKAGAGALNLDSLMGGASSGGGADSIGANIDLQTESAILQADSIELKVIQDLHLEGTKDFKPKFSVFGYLLNFVTPKDPTVASSSNSLEDSPVRRQQVLKVFKKNLHVNVVAGTRLVQVTYTSTDPRTAAAVANALVHSLVEYTFQTKFAATSEVSEWLEQQLGDLRKQSEDLQTRVVSLQKTTGLYGLTGTGPDEKAMVYSPVLERLQDATRAYSEAQANEIMKGSIYRTVQTGDADLISQLSGTGSSANSSQGVTQTLSLIQTLRAQEATLQAQISLDAAKFGPAYPKLIEERASLARVQQSLREEITRVQIRAKNDEQIAENALIGAEKVYTADKQEASKLNDRTIEYSIVSREAEQSQKLYQSLLERLREAGILEGLRSSSITIVDQARTSAKPSHPSTIAYLFAAVTLALFGGMGISVLWDSIDDAVQSADEVIVDKLPLLGVLPFIRQEEFQREAGESAICLIRRPSSPYSEAIRRLRSSLLISRGSNPPQVCLVSSATAQEGKSTTSMELATSFAQLGKKVLVIEADLRRPILKNRLKLKYDGGLSFILSGQSSSLDFPSLPGLPALSILPAGPIPPSPADLLSSEKMVWLIHQCREKYDLIIIDSAPVLAATDAEVLVHFVDATLLIVRAGSTSRVSMRRAVDLLMQHVATVPQATFGVVVNGLLLTSSGYYGYYGSRNLDYSEEATS
jgi:succinoglycan biosynthesis transport protein ExoP